MDRRGVAEMLGAALVSGAVAAVSLWLFAGHVDWVLVGGVGVGVALASGLSYRDRPSHDELVDDEL